MKARLFSRAFGARRGAPVLRRRPKLLRCCRWSRVAGAGGLFLLLALTQHSLAQTHPCATPWSEAGPALSEVARPKEVALLQLSLIAPIALGQSGGDHALRTFAQDQLGGRYKAEPVTLAAPYALIGLSALAYGGALGLDHCPLQRTSSAMLFAAFETVLVVGLEKWILGRAYPTNGRDPYAEDRLNHPEDATVYEPFRRGIAAFPSGHTATVFALAAALRASSPQWGAYRYLGYPIAIAVGFGMWWGDHHWASDVIAGALIGEALGGATGRAWASSAETPSWSWLMIPSRQGAILTVSGQY